MARIISWTAQIAVGISIALGTGFAATSLITPVDAAVGDAVDLYEPETVRSNGATLRWSRYTGPSGAAFDRYEVHRSSVAGFTPSASTLLTTIRDRDVTTFNDTTAAPGRSFAYRVVANASASAERAVATPAEGSAVMTLQPGPSHGKATYLRNAAGGCPNNGDANVLSLGGGAAVERPIVHFDLHDIPAKATITDATLSLYRASSVPAATTVDVHRAQGEWTEGSSGGTCSGTGATWNETVGGLSWTARGGDFVSSAAASKTHAAGAAAGWDSFDVKGVAQQWVDGAAPNMGLLLKARDEGPGAATLRYSSDDDLMAADKRPKLIVRYQDGSKSLGPSVKLKSHEAGALVTGHSVALEAEAGDDRRVENVEFLVDGASIGTDTSEPFGVSWDSSTVSTAAHTLTVKATDDVGNTSTQATGVEVANTAAPTTTVTSPSSRYADVVKADGPYGYWRLGEASGTTVSDASGKGNRGTLSGSYLLSQTGLVTGDADKAIKFRNTTTDGKVTVGTLAGQSSQAVSVEALINYAGTAGTDVESELASRGWGSAGGWRLSVYKIADGTSRVKFAVNVAGTIKNSTGVITPGRNHVAGRFSGTSVGVFVNGVFSYGTTTASQALTTTGSVLLAGNLNEDVLIDELAIYPTSMSTAEAALHHDVGLARTPTLAGDSNMMVATAGDDRGVHHVDFYVDGNYVGNDSTRPYDVGLKTKVKGNELWNGQHTLTTKAYDAEDQEKQSTTETINVDNTGGSSKFAADLAAATAPPAELTYVPGAATQDEVGVEVDIKNRTTSTWGSTDVVLRPRWIAPDGTVTEQPEVSLGSDLPAGQIRRATVKVTPPAPADGSSKAQHTLRVDAYSKTNGAFFADKGNKPLDTPVIVKKAAGDLGLERYFHYDGEELGAGMQHLANLATGNSLVRFTPLSSEGRGLSTVVDLTYNSLEEKSESPVGNNWSLSISSLTRFGSPLDVHPNKADDIAGNPKRYVDITDGDGTTHRFVGRQAADGSVYWEEPAGVHLYLREHSSTDPQRKWAISRPDGVTYFFDSDGYPTSVEDKNTNRISFTQEAIPPGEDPGGQKKRITAVTDAGGQSYRIAYFSKAQASKPKVRGNVRSITDHSGSEISFRYYDDGNLLRISQAGGSYSDGSVMISRAWYFTYTTPNGDGPAIPVAADRQHPDPHTPSQSTRLFSVRDPRLNETTFAYLAGTTTGQQRWKLDSRTDRAGAKTSYAYDAGNRTTTVTAPLSRVSKFAFDADNQVTKITNPKNEDTGVVWTPDRHVEQVTTPREGTPSTVTRRFAYNQNGQLTDLWNEKGEQTRLAYTDLRAAPGDVGGKWKSGRTVPHLSRLRSKTDPKGMATPAVAGDYEWTFEYDSADTLGNLVRVIDPVAGDAGKATVITPNADGTLASIADPNGNTMRFPSYHHSGQPTKVIDGENRTTEFGYDDDGFLRWIQDPAHAGETGGSPREYRTYFDYDSWHRMGRQSTPKSTTKERGTLIWSAVRFERNDNVYDVIAPHYGAQYTGTGAVTHTDFDAMDRPTLVTGPDKEADPAGERFRYVYDTAGRLAELTDPGGMASAAAQDGTTFFDYDDLDRVKREHRKKVDAGGAVTKTLYTHYCYDVAGDLRAIVPPAADTDSVNCGDRASLPKATRLGYDEAHRPVSSQQPGKAERKSGYDANGDLISTTDEANSTSTREYDERGLLTKVVAPFDAGGRKLTTKYEYDHGGRLAREVSPRAWDTAPGRSSYEGADFVTDYVYDRADQLTRIDLPKRGTAQRHYVHRGYDANGNLTSTSLPTDVSDPGQVPAERQTRLSYYDPGWIASSDEKAKRKVQFDYFAEGWQHTRTGLDGDGSLDLDRQRTWTYYLDGMLKDERVGEKYDLSSYTYDANNQLTRAHDESGLRNSTKDKAIDVEIDYDSLGLPTKVRHSDSRRDDRWVRTDYGYDLNGNVSRRVDNILETTTGTQVEAGRVNGFVYDDADLLTEHTDEGDPAKADDTRIITTTYTPTGWEDLRTVKVNGALRQSTDWKYFLTGQVQTLETKNKDGAIKESHDISYLENGSTGAYLNGHRTQDAWRRASPKPESEVPCQTQDCRTVFTYDARDRPTDERIVRPGRPDRLTHYDLDPAGNVLKEDRDNGRLVKESTYTADRLETRKVTEAGTSVTFRYHHDGYGNLRCITTESGALSDCPASKDAAPSDKLLAGYVFDKDDRLSSYRRFDLLSHTVDDSAEYHYDVLDRPVEELEDHETFSDARRTLFRYVGTSTQVAEEEQRKVLRGDLTASGTLDETKRYSYDAFGRRTAMTNVEAASGGNPEKSEDYTYGQDVHGSVSLLLDKAGAAKASYGYTLYGETDEELTAEQDLNGAARAPDSKDPVNPYRHGGKRFDTGSDTLDMGARRFSPGVSRFLQEDVYQDAIGDLSLSTDPLTANRYSLAAGNPVSFVETDGHRIAPDSGSAPGVKGEPDVAVRAFTDARSGSPARTRATIRAAAAESNRQGGLDEVGIGFAQAAFEAGKGTAQLVQARAEAFKKHGFMLPARDLQNVAGAVAHPGRTASNTWNAFAAGYKNCPTTERCVGRGFFDGLSLLAGGTGAGIKATQVASASKAAAAALPTPIVTDTKLQNLVNDIYKGTTNPGRVGTGTTGDAVRAERLSGQPTAGKFHFQKAQNTARGLDKWLRRNPGADYRDRVVAQSLRDELHDALGVGR